MYDKKYLEYLDILQKSGAVNMFGATSLLREKFPEISKHQSIMILSHWMKTYDPLDDDAMTTRYYSYDAPQI